MTQRDDFSSYCEELLDGVYDCVDRIILNGYFASGSYGGGFRTWWRQLTGGDETLDEEHLKRMAGRFSRRVRAFALEHNIGLIDCGVGEPKHELAQKHRPQDPTFRGVFLILVAKAPALVWQAHKTKTGAPHLERKKPWPFVNHYHFHIIDPQWGHLTIKMSGHPPFGVQIMLNGHEWVDRLARKRTISLEKEGNCFVGGAIQAADQLADTLRAKRAIGQLAAVCDRWIYSSCLCFGLDLEEQRRSGFRYQYSCYQIEYSRNLLFHSGAMLDEVYQGLIDRSRRLLSLPRIKTILGYKHRPYRTARTRPRLERIVTHADHDLTIFKVQFGALILKIYDKGARLLRIEVTAHDAKKLRIGKRLDKFPALVTALRQMLCEFLNALHPAHISYLDDQRILDTLPLPTQRGARRLAGVDLAKQRMRAVTQALLTLTPNPQGFTIKELAAATRRQLTSPYTTRNAAYDLAKLRGKTFVDRIANSRRYRTTPDAIRTLAALFILREHVIKPVIAGVGKPRLARPPKCIHPIDQHYEALCHEMRRTFETLRLAA